MALAIVVVCVSCMDTPKKEADALFEMEFTDFPTKAYDADTVHPVRKTGAVSGQEAINEISLIEWEYIRHCGYAYSKDVETNMIRLIKNMGKRDYQ